MLDLFGVWSELVSILSIHRTGATLLPHHVSTPPLSLGRGPAREARPVLSAQAIEWTYKFQRDDVGTSVGRNRSVTGVEPCER